MGKTKLLGVLALVCFIAVWYIYQAMKLPATKPYFGIHLEGFPIDESRLENEFEGWIQKPDFIGFFKQWPSEPLLFSRQQMLETLEAIKKAGAVAVLSWEPMIIENGSEVVVSADEVLSGRWDEYIKSFSEVLSEFGNPLIIRFGHEMNLVRYHWGSTSKDYPDSPPLYREMFRYVRKQTIEHGADNAAWMFCPNHQPLTALDPPAQDSWNTMKVWFPGREYVDLLGIDGYNWGNSLPGEDSSVIASWQSPWDIFSDPIEELRSLAPDLPVLIGETSSAEIDGRRSNWIEQLLLMASKRRLEAVFWFHVDKERNWRIRPDEAALMQSLRQKPGLPGAKTWLADLIALRNGQAREFSSAME
jgi:mannan endo-1,4-beta-mannosidase